MKKRLKSLVVILITVVGLGILSYFIGLLNEFMGLLLILFIGYAILDLIKTGLKKLKNLKGFF